MRRKIDMSDRDDEKGPWDRILGGLVGPASKMSKNPKEIRVRITEHSIEGMEDDANVGAMVFEDENGNPVDVDKHKELVVEALERGALDEAVKAAPAAIRKVFDENPKILSAIKSKLRDGDEIGYRQFKAEIPTNVCENPEDLAIEIRALWSALNILIEHTELNDGAGKRIRPDVLRANLINTVETALSEESEEDRAERQRRQRERTTMRKYKMGGPSGGVREN